MEILKNGSDTNPKHIYVFPCQISFNDYCNANHNTSHVYGNPAENAAAHFHLTYTRDKSALF
jgi:hypothetical protein